MHLVAGAAVSGKGAERKEGKDGEGGEGGGRRGGYKVENVGGHVGVVAEEVERSLAERVGSRQGLEAAARGVSVCAQPTLQALRGVRFRRCEEARPATLRARESRGCAASPAQHRAKAKRNASTPTFDSAALLSALLLGAPYAVSVPETP